MIVKPSLILTDGFNTLFILNSITPPKYLVFKIILKVDPSRRHVSKELRLSYKEQSAKLGGYGNSSKLLLGNVIWI